MTQDHYAVMGNPIKHSQSPTIHGLFAQQTGQQMTYEKLLVAEDAFVNTVAAFWQQGGKGLNITVPFKQAAWALAEVKDDLAETAGAVNTLMQRDGQIYGYNTDGVGLVRDLTENCQISLADTSILILGAGGAARGVMLPLLKMRPKRIWIANRTAEKAAQLVDQFSAYGPVVGSGLDAIEGTFELVINATAAGLTQRIPHIDPALIHARSACYDMMYGQEPTAFVAWAKTQGARVVFDGLGMLVEQAAQAFNLWRQVVPNTAPVIAQLRG